MLQSAFNAVFRLKRAGPFEPPLGGAAILSTDEADFVLALQRSGTDGVSEPGPVSLLAVQSKPEPFKPAEPPPLDAIHTPELRARIRIGPIEVARIYNSGSAEIAAGYPELKAIIGEMPPRRLCGPELADHLIARCVGKLERFNVVIDWARTAVTQKEWQIRQANPGQMPRDRAHPAGFA